MNDILKFSEIGDIEAVKKAVTSGDLTKDDLDGALYHAAKEKHKELTEFLVAANANVDIALASAASNGWLDIVTLLLDKGANPDPESGLPIVLAAQQGHADIVEFLIAKGASVNAGAGQPIVFASTRNHLDVVKLLVENGAQVNPAAGSPLSVAYGHNNLEVIKYLEENGALKVDEYKVLQFEGATQ